MAKLSASETATYNAHQVSTYISLIVMSLQCIQIKLCLHFLVHLGINFRYDRQLFSFISNA